MYAKAIYAILDVFVAKTNYALCLESFADGKVLNLCVPAVLPWVQKSE